MNVGEQLLTAFSLYGLPFLGTFLFVGCLGIPLPNALLLVASGSFVAGGQLNLWAVLIVASAASIAGDMAGYIAGRWLGRGALSRRSPKFQERMERAEQSMHKWGGWGIFLTRWLLTPAGPWVNLISGASRYPWLRFFFWDVIGEILWVALYVSIGRLVASEVQAISSLASDITWVVVALAAAAVLGWIIIRSLRPRPS